MPYILRGIRKDLDDGAAPQEAGDLTYLLYRATLDWDGGSRADFHLVLGEEVDRFLAFRPRKYQIFAEILGSLYSTALEYERQHEDSRKALAIYAFASAFYSEVIAPYEDTKIQQNGDVT